MSPYLQVPFSWKGRHNSVLYRLELMATPELDLLPAVEEPEDDEAEDEGMELKRNILQLLMYYKKPTRRSSDQKLIFGDALTRNLFFHDKLKIARRT